MSALYPDEYSRLYISFPRPASPPRFRPWFWRKTSAPGALEGASLPWHARRSESGVQDVFERVRARVEEAVSDAESEVEAGCFRCQVNAVKWYLWHRWRR